MRLVSKEPNSASGAHSELGCMNLAAQCAKCLSEYTRDVHLRTADAFRDLGFGHILEESKHQGGSLTLRQSSDQGTYRFNVDHRTQVGIDVAEALTERSVFVVWPGRHVGRNVWSSSCPRSRLRQQVRGRRQDDPRFRRASARDQAVGIAPARLNQLSLKVFETAGYFDRPPEVAEVAAYLAHHGRHGEC